MFELSGVPVEVGATLDEVVVELATGGYMAFHADAMAEFMAANASAPTGVIAGSEMIVSGTIIVPIAEVLLDVEDVSVPVAVGLPLLLVPQQKLPLPVPSPPKSGGQKGQFGRQKWTPLIE